MEKSYEVEYVPLENRSEKLLREFSQKFREVFSNAPYNQYLLDPVSKKAYSPQEVFGIRDYIEIEKLEDFKKGAPDKILWLDPEKTFQIILGKLKRKDAFLAIVRDAKSKKIMGGTFAYIGSLNEAFYLYEEWDNPYLYSGLGSENNEKNINRFIRLMEESLEKFENNVNNLTRDTKFMVWNCVFLAPEVRGKGAFNEVMSNLARNVPTRFDIMPLIAEIIKNTKAEELFKPVGFVETGYNLGENHPVVVQKTRNFKQIFPSVDD